MMERVATNLTPVYQDYDQDTSRSSDFTSQLDRLQKQAEKLWCRNVDLEQKNTTLERKNKELLAEIDLERQRSRRQAHRLAHLADEIEGGAVIYSGRSETAENDYLEKKKTNASDAIIFEEARSLVRSTSTSNFIKAPEVKTPAPERLPSSDHITPPAESSPLESFYSEPQRDAGRTVTCFSAEEKDAIKTRLLTHRGPARRSPSHDEFGNQPNEADSIIEAKQVESYEIAERDALTYAREIFSSSAECESSDTTRPIPECECATARPDPTASDLSSSATEDICDGNNHLKDDHTMPECSDGEAGGDDTDCAFQRHLVAGPAADLHSPESQDSTTVFGKPPGHAARDLAPDIVQRPVRRRDGSGCATSQNGTGTAVRDSTKPENSPLAGVKQQEPKRGSDTLASSPVTCPHRLEDGVMQTLSGVGLAPVTTPTVVVNRDASFSLAAAPPTSGAEESTPTRARSPVARGPSSCRQSPSASILTVATARRSTPTNSAAGQNASDHEDEEGWNSSADDTSTLTRNRFRHTTYCCSCSEPRSESRAIGMCDGCPRIVCRDCGTRLLCVKIPDGDAPDVILPSGKCFCRWRDFQFPKPPEGVQPEAHLLRHLVLHDLSAQFRDEVDVTENSGYLGVITREEMMDLSTISNKVRHRKAWTKRERSTFRLEVQQIWRNCWKFAGYDPESNAPIPGIVSCTLILRAMVDKFYKMHMPELTSAYGEGSSLHGKPLIKEVRRKTTHGGPPQSSVSRPDPHVAPSSSFDSDEETESEYEFEQPTELSVVRRKRKCPDGTLAIERGERYGDIVGEANANELDETTSTAGAARDDTVPESQGLRENLCRMADIGERLVRGEL